MNRVDVIMEMGRKKCFAVAVDWPGWARSGRDEAQALQALLDHGARYGTVLQRRGIVLQPPTGIGDLRVVERQTGNASTDFGAPAMIPAVDRPPLDRPALERLQPLLLACWQAFDTAVQQATGKELRKGPRGGGRDTDKMIEHVLEADGAYLGRLAWKYKRAAGKSAVEQLLLMRQAIEAALEAAVLGQLPQSRPRGGAVWPPRYFIRRAAWHILDHAWEIEDRL